MNFSSSRYSLQDPLAIVQGDKIAPEQVEKPTLSNFSLSKHQKSDIIKQNYQNLNSQILQRKVNEFLTTKVAPSQVVQDPFHDKYCICCQCIYSRNLSKPSHSLFNLTMRSIYTKQYKPISKSNVKDVKSLEQKGGVVLPSLDIKTIQHQDDVQDKEVKDIARSTMFNSGQVVEFQTVYRKDLGKDVTQPKVNSARIKDTLKFQGPTIGISTYKEKFVGVKGGNPYIKPVQKAIRQSFKLQTRTINSTFYRGQPSVPSKLSKSPDQLKLGLPLLYKQSSSSKFFSSPKNSFNKSFIIPQPKYHQNPEDKHQYQTIYRNSFYGGDVYESVRNRKRLIRETMGKLGMK